MTESLQHLELSPLVPCQDFEISVLTEPSSRQVARNLPDPLFHMGWGLGTRVELCVSTMCGPSALVTIIVHVTSYSPGLGEW